MAVLVMPVVEDKQKLTLALVLVAFLAMMTRADENPAVVATIDASDLKEYPELSREIRGLIDASLELTRKDLAYSFGSASPEKGGMDCSGTICHLLKSRDCREVPRMAHTIYLWVEKEGDLTKIADVHDPNHPALAKLEPGDLLFWEGTYAVAERDPPISHVMLYLGTLKKDGKGVLFGASSGRRFRGKKIHGVSVFDFKVPSRESKAKLVAYGSIPGIEQEVTVVGSPKRVTLFRKEEREEAADQEAAVNTPPSKPKATPKRPSVSGGGNQVRTSSEKKRPVRALLKLFSKKRE